MTSTAITPQTDSLEQPQVFCVEDLICKLPENMELVDGKLVEKTGMTFKHSLAQANLVSLWRQYAIDSGQGGKAVTEAPCRTMQQIRRPDVAYITAELIEQTGEFNTFSQSFSLIAEVASPDDKAEELLTKTREYLHSGSQEVWLLFPENQMVMLVTQQQWLIFTECATISTKIVLPGFNITIDKLFA